MRRPGDIARRLIVAVWVTLAFAGVTAGVARGGAAPKKKARTERRAAKRSAGDARPATPASKSELQRQQRAAQQDIAETRRKIKENDREVSRNLADLGKLQGDIEATRGRVQSSTRKVNLLNGQISGLTTQIAAGEKELARMRQEYLKSLKKIRSKRGTQSVLAYIFSSRSLGDARRRIRYLRQFADWRKRKSAQICVKVKQLDGQRAALADSRRMHDRELAHQQTERQALERQYKQKDALVVTLRANGAALKDHLARRQAEANALKGQVAALIAAEQRAAEQRAREEARQEQLRAEARRAAELKAREEQERREAAALAAADKERDEVAKEKPAAQKKEKEKPKKKDNKKKDNRQKEKPVKNNNAYAEARKRRPRGSGGSTGSSSAPTQNTRKKGEEAVRRDTPVSGGRFEAMRGSLPRPVAGSFRIVSRFGVHELPDLPNVKYDNPGIDAEVSAGAAAQAVYGGKVSGVYVIPGFNTVVIVSHGEYYTVYGNLSAASVRVGQVVKQGETLGRVAPSEDNPGIGQIHFEVWRNRDKQNPEAWIR